MRPIQQVWVLWSAGAPLIAKMGDIGILLMLAALFFFRYTNDELFNHSNQRLQRRKWTWEDKHYTVILGATQQNEGIEKMIEIWADFTRFKSTSEIPDTVTETLNTEMPETSNQKEKLSISDRNTI